jgi:hypothetical protein
MARCAGNKRNGAPCTATVEPPQTHCWWHDDSNKEQRQRAASRGGKSKPSRVSRDLHLLLESLTEQVVAGSLPPYPASVAGQLVGVRLRLLEYERRVKEQDELVGRLEELEGQITAEKNSESRRSAWGV